MDSSQVRAGEAGVRTGQSLHLRFRVGIGGGTGLETRYTGSAGPRLRVRVGMG